MNRGLLRALFFALLFGVSIISLYGERQYSIWGFTFNKLTMSPLDSVKVVLEHSNGTVDTTYSAMRRVNYKSRPFFSFDKLTEGEYILHCFHKGYEAVKLPVSIKKQNNSLIVLDFIYLAPKKEHRLGEAKVRASRIKMYHKGDTVVFDADAFNLSKGSMLEALIAELPGVKMNDNGEIFVNDRKVDDLYLNGKDFFRGNRFVLLENLPSYMVKDIKVYERDYALRRPTDPKPYTMDVVLKKQYAQGWIANAELAGGTSERYLGRMFGLRFTNCSRLSLYGDMNNVNDNRKPGYTGDWEPQDALRGRQRTRKGGVDFYVEDKMDMWSFNTANEVNDSRANTETEEKGTTFLPAGNAYRQSLSRQVSKNTQWKSRNKWNLKIGNPEQLTQPINMEATANISYRTFNSDLASKTADQDLPFDSLGSIDFGRLLAATSESQWYSHLLNRSQSDAFQRGYELKADGKLEGRFSPKKSTNSLFSNFYWNYTKSNTTGYSRQRIDYPAGGDAAGNVYRHLYNRTPYEKYGMSGRLEYAYWLPFNVGILPSVEYRHNYNSSDRTLFNLERLDKWGVDDGRSLTDLPSTRDSLQMAFDAANSYYSSTYENSVVTAVSIQGEVPIKDNAYRTYINVNLPLNTNHTKLYYDRGTLQAELHRVTRFFTPNANFSVYDYKRKMSYGIDISSYTSAPSLVYKLDITDDVNPLYIQRGNSSLKNTTSYYANVFVSRSGLPHYGSWSTSMNYNVVRNTVAMSVLYDSGTGVRTTRPDNVNGNWNLGGNTNYSRCLDKKDRLTFDTRTGYRYLHSVDLTGTTAVERSVVETLNLNEELSLKYKIGKNTLGVKGKVAWSNIDSERSGFSSMNVTDFSYGMTALLNLPWKLQLNTDLTMFSRRGYESASMNTDDLVWNARLSRVFLGGSLTCFVDGFDLLGNLSNVVRNVNAQGRTETRYNVVPRYVMLHVIYRLNKQPKKKQ